MADGAGRWGVNRLVGSLVNPVVDAVDLDGVIERVDLNEALARVDVNELLDRIDVNELLDRVDVNRLLDRVDVDRLMDRADVAQLVARADITNIMTGTATSAATSVIDFGRSQLAGFDTVTGKVVGGVIRRPLLPRRAGEPVIADDPAGAFSRLVAYAIDATLVTILFAAGVFLTTYILNLFLNHDFQPTNTGGAWWAAVGFGFAGLYWWVGLAFAGRTIGKALLGLKVVRLDGSPVGPLHAFIRVCVFPFSFILGLGFIPIVTTRDRRAMHDHAATTKEIYSWGRRTARLPHAYARLLTPKADRDKPVPTDAAESVSDSTPTP
jgi:uncharacterized RDD family membrane protein YckC